MLYSDPKTGNPDLDRFLRINGFVFEVQLQRVAWNNVTFSMEFMERFMDIPGEEIPRMVQSKKHALEILGQEDDDDRWYKGALMPLLKMRLQYF
jgi:hypothetical protein